MQRERHKAVWLRMLAVKEIRLARDTQKLLKKQAREIAAAYKKGGHAGAETAAAQSQTDWFRVLVPNYTVTIKDFSQYLLDQLGQKSRKASFTDLTTSFIARQSAYKSKILTDTTKEIATRVIQSGERDGLGVEEIAKNLVNAISDSSLSKGRAAIIARTETHMAAGYAMQAQASDLGYPVTKTWVAVEDDRTRETHSAVDGTTIGNNEYFDVGSDRLLYPGDPDGSLDEIINCRCTVIVEPAGNIFSEEFIDE